MRGIVRDYFATDDDDDDDDDDLCIANSAFPDSTAPVPVRCMARALLFLIMFSYKYNSIACSPIHEVSLSLLSARQIISKFIVYFLIRNLLSVFSGSYTLLSFLINNILLFSLFLTLTKMYSFFYPLCSFLCCYT